MTSTDTIQSRLRTITARSTGGFSSDFDLNNDHGLRPPQDLRPASVLIGLVKRNAGWNVLLTQRTAALAHHPGQIAFPGGKREDGEDDIGAALREAQEEIGLAPEQAHVIGALDMHQTVTGFAVTPVISTISSDFTPRPDPSEVAEVFEVPFDFLMDKQRTRIEGRMWQGQKRRYFVMPYGPYYVWGATARILVKLQDMWATE